MSPSKVSRTFHEGSHSLAPWTPPAKANVQGLTHHNGKCDCPFCLNPGENVSSGNKKNGHVHVYSAKTEHPVRTVRETIAHAKVARDSQSTVSITFFVLDFMYFFGFLFFVFYFIVWYRCLVYATSPLFPCFPSSILSGAFRLMPCMRYFLECQKGSPVSGLTPSTENAHGTMGHRLSEIDSLLRELLPPRGIKRMPRSLKDRQHWKGPRFLLFLLFFLSQFFLLLCQSLRIQELAPLLRSCDS
jgi:hypothetical protein